MHESSWFVTLTYDQEHLPADVGLHKREWQLFAKRLRKRKGPFRFFMCGEYGGLHKRPHFHAVLFGLDFPDVRPIQEGRRGAKSPRESSYEMFTSDELVACWKRGYVTLGSVTPQSIAYVVKYAGKKRGRHRQEEERYDLTTGEVWEVQPEFVGMSRRPGLGDGWFKRFEQDVFPSDECVVGGTRFGVPRFYMDRGKPEVVALVKERRKERAEKDSANSSFERMRVREAVAESRKAVVGH